MMNDFLTWRQLAKAIEQLPDEELDKPANVFMQQTGMQPTIRSIDLAEDWVEPADHKFSLIYNRYA